MARKVGRVGASNLGGSIVDAREGTGWELRRDAQAGNMMVVMVVASNEAGQNPEGQGPSRAPHINEENLTDERRA